MKIKNTNAQKAFVVKAEHIKQGGEKTADGKNIYINPGDTVVIDDEVGAKLVESYENLTVIEKAEFSGNTKSKKG